MIELGVPIINYCIFGGKEIKMDVLYLIVNKITGEIIARVISLKEAFEKAHGDLIIWEI